MKTLDMNDMRQLNLFERITKVRTMVYFNYNKTLFFCVPRNLLKKALGEDKKNVKKIHQILGKKIRIIAKPRGTKEIKSFIKTIVTPIKIDEIKIEDNLIKVKADKQNRALLIGRDKVRLNEMKRIIRDFFGKEFEVSQEL